MSTASDLPSHDTVPRLWTTVPVWATVRIVWAMGWYVYGPILSVPLPFLSPPLFPQRMAQGWMARGGTITRKSLDNILDHQFRNTYHSYYDLPVGYRQIPSHPILILRGILSIY